MGVAGEPAARRRGRARQRRAGALWAWRAPSVRDSRAMLGAQASAPAQAGPKSAAGQAAPGARSLTLDEAVRTALEQSPVIRGAVADLDAALARLEQARAARRPAVSANTFGSAGNAANILAGV